MIKKSNLNFSGESEGVFFTVSISKIKYIL